MEKALVTGGAGFIGSNIAEKLVEEGVEVVVLDSLYLGEESNLEEIKDEVEFVEGSVLDMETVREAIEGCDTVFHQAARSSSPMHKDDAAEGARVNIEGFINTIEAAKEEENMEKVVYASTSSMYGSVEPPHEEDNGEYPTNLYTASKMSRELYAKVYSQQTDMHFTGLRYFSVFGPHEKGKGKYANVVTQFLWKMMDGEQPVIWGDGTQSRDFTYVKDIARANYLAAERKEETDGEYYNIGTGRDIDFNSLVEKLNQALGTEIEPEHIEHPRDNPVMTTKADYSRAKRDLGYEPKHSFEEGLEKTVEYYRNHL
ncbi:SDR family NAD(P)-dependent oxidoreductase [Candidatus Nanohalovita haloferacivicina]|uniref:SDR family NAD(P)-dependent oxidoreductase n=1 Tax=Candidatus Nanohalovita haloferacivicina TaxID=2978046 RepID=UPI00325F9A8A|nr:UDP-glucose 4-epimerase [Candidatus Nanohalobia archaeon BNXNv]